MADQAVRENELTASAPTLPSAQEESTPTAPKEKKERSEAQLDALKRARELKSHRRPVVKNGELAESFASYSGQGSRRAGSGVNVSPETLVIGGALLVAGAGALYLAKKSSQDSTSNSLTALPTNPNPPPVTPETTKKSGQNPLPTPPVGNSAVAALPSLTSSNYGSPFGGYYRPY